MTSSLIIGFFAFAFVSAMTPGPNNVMLLASGANFGFRRTVPHIVGVCVGYTVMVLVVGFGLAGVFAAAPWLYGVVQIAGALYLLFLAYKIATADGLGSGRASANPFTFLQAAAFQWVNPKALTAVVGSVATYVPKDRFVAGVAVIAAISLAVTILSTVTWSTFGMSLKRLLNRPMTLRVFNVIMALLLVASLYPLLETFSSLSLLQPFAVVGAD